MFAFPPNKIKTNAAPSGSTIPRVLIPIFWKIGAGEITPEVPEKMELPAKNSVQG
jgi:hypothetical protein